MELQSELSGRQRGLKVVGTWTLTVPNRTTHALETFLHEDRYNVSQDAVFEVLQWLILE